MSSNFLGILRKRFFRQLFVWFFHEFEWNSFRSSSWLIFEKFPPDIPPGVPEEDFSTVRAGNSSRSGKGVSAGDSWSKSCCDFLGYCRGFSSKSINDFYQKFPLGFLRELLVGTPPEVSAGEFIIVSWQGCVQKFTLAIFWEATAGDSYRCSH